MPHPLTWFPLTKPGPSPVPRTPSKSSDKELEAPEAFTPALEVSVRAPMVSLPAGACISTGASAEADSMLQLSGACLHKRQLCAMRSTVPGMCCPSSGSVHVAALVMGLLCL